MSVGITIKEFLGYDQMEIFETSVKAMRKNHRVTPTSTRTPLPRFRARKVDGSAVVADGQTLVLRGGTMVAEAISKDKVPVLGDLPLAGRLFRRERKLSVTKQLVIFVTPRLIDSAGLQLHDVSAVK